MQGSTNETVGEQFSADLLQQARDKTLAVILEAAPLMKPGMTETDAKNIIQKIQTQKGGLKSWHPPQIRFGENTLLVFGEKGMERTLQPNDIFFFDIGPIFDSHEGDVGRPFTLGSDPDMSKCCEDAKALWHEVRDHWKSTQVTGGELYDFAKKCTERRGWTLSLNKANGHRIADFPHAARIRGSIEGFKKKPAPNRWILEIQIRHPEKPYGAFYEDLLN